jgi:transcriptional regulator with XRE-family HTH domain
MPAKAPPTGDLVAARLTSLGQRIRARRKQHKVTATTAAEAAGMSRVTLHRIERGEPSVTMGAYMSAAAALGLEMNVTDPVAQLPVSGSEGGLQPHIRLDEYPQLRRLAWQLDGATELTPEQALNLYERNWRHVERAAMGPDERALVQALVARLGGGRPLV